MKNPGPLQGEVLEKFMQQFKDEDTRCAFKKGDRVVKSRDDNDGKDLHLVGDLATVVSTIFLTEQGAGYIVQFDRDLPHVLVFIVESKLEAYAE